MKNQSINMLRKFWVLVVVLVVFVQQTQQTKCNDTKGTETKGNDDGGVDLGQGIDGTKETDKSDANLGQGKEETKDTNDSNDDDGVDLGQGVGEAKDTEDGNDEDDVDLGQGVGEAKDTDDGNDEDDVDLGQGDSNTSNCKTPAALELFLKGLNPRCDADGNLSKMQCSKDSKFCVCVRKDGSFVRKPSKRLKGCECPVEKDEQENTDLIGNFIPQCQKNGLYSKKQCHYSTGYCYCADPTTGKNTTVPGRKRVHCS